MSPLNHSTSDTPTVPTSKLGGQVPPAGSSLWRFAFASLTEFRSERVLRVGTEANMDNTTLLIIIVLVLLLFGGGYYGRGRWW